MSLKRLAVTLLFVLSLASAPHSDVLDFLQRGLAARQRGDNDVAIYYLSAAIATGVLSPKDLATVLVSRGVAYERKGETDSPIADFGVALELRPDFGDAYIDRGWPGSRSMNTAEQLPNSPRHPTRTPNMPFLHSTTEEMFMTRKATTSKPSPIIVRPSA
jgi:hypothetical protein